MEIKKAGMAAVVGRPNVGKSTLVNALVGEKVAIVSPKPQTTRNRIMGVAVENDAQIVLLDTPGLLIAKNKLGEYMKKASISSVNDVDVAVFVVEPQDWLHPAEKTIVERLAEADLPVILVINKTDAAPKEAIASAIRAYSEFGFAEYIPVSARTGDGMDIVKKTLAKYMPEGAPLFDETEFTDQPVRVMVAEIVREKALLLLDKEVPHGIAVEVVKYVCRDNGIIDIGVDIYCEKQSHKGIIIGKGGAMLKRIASLARRDIEELVGGKVYLETFVKVRESWRDNSVVLKDLGYGYDK